MSKNNFKIYLEIKVEVLMSFEILNYRPNPRDGVLKANFSVKVVKWGGFIISNCTLFDKGSSRWVAMPSQIVEKDGKKVYYPYIKFDDRDTQQAFVDGILKALDTHISTMPVTNPHSLDEDRGGVPF